MATSVIEGIHNVETHTEFSDMCKLPRTSIEGILSVLSNGKHKCYISFDVSGIIFAVLTWLLILYAEFVVMKVVLLPAISTHPVYSYVNIVIFQFLAFHALASHLKTMFTDPGAVPKGTATGPQTDEMCLPEGQVLFICRKCRSIKPARAYHCSICQRCIKKLDHHCPWVNNCVGEGNQKYFVLFTFYVATMSIQAISICVFQFLNCEWRACSVYSLTATVLLIIGALFFANFAAAILGLQLDAIWNDETATEKLNDTQAQWIRKLRWEGMQAVFGRFSIFWFCPFIEPKPIGSDAPSLRV